MNAPLKTSTALTDVTLVEAADMVARGETTSVALTAAAIEAFQRAYDLRQLPRLLLNIGQAHRKLGHAREALESYRLYLRAEPSPPLTLARPFRRAVAVVGSRSARHR